MQISALGIGYRKLNEQVLASLEDVNISECCGQRFIGAGLKNKSVVIDGTPGNALGAYLDGGGITVKGNVQDAVGDTMNDGEIIIHGDAGDALGYAMRGGRIFVKGNSGYRTGIHMKEYQEKKPVIIVGGTAGSFLGEYLAGGLIVVLGLGTEGVPVGNFTGTGMHGGSIFIRGSKKPRSLPEQVCAKPATAEDLSEIEPYLREFAANFSMDANQLLSDSYYVLRPNTNSPYKQLYTAN